MKTIEFTEYTYVLHAYPATMEISEEDFKKIENDEIKIEDIIDKYEVDYCDSEQLDDSYVDSYEYLGEI